jgi:quercetin dioxygenase-like cupin family protein
MNNGRRTALFLLLALTALPMGSSPAAATERAQAEAVMLTPGEVTWTPDPASLPPGAKIAILEGDPKEEGLVTIRLALPPDFKLMPHTHPDFERVTVLSGTLYFGLGEKMEPAKAKPLPAGSFFVFPPDTGMFGFTKDQETVIQLNVKGPWDVHYINPADDPRTQK